jgi:hypothetical protein
MQSKGQLAGQHRGVVDGIRMSTQKSRHLVPAAQMSAAEWGEPTVHLVQAATGAHRRHGHGQPPAVWRREVGARCRHRHHSITPGKVGEHRVALVVVGHALRSQFHGHVLAAEQFDQLTQRRIGGIGSFF